MEILNQQKTCINQFLNLDFSIDQTDLILYLNFWPNIIFQPIQVH